MCEGTMTCVLHVTAKSRKGDGPIRHEIKAEIILTPNRGGNIWSYSSYYITIIIAV